MTFYNKQSIVTRSEENGFKYKSWQEEGERFVVPDKTLVKYRCDVAYLYDDKAQVEHDHIVSDMTRRLSGCDTFVHIKDANSVPGLRDFVTMTDGKYCVRCMRSTITKIIYRVLFFLGYHSIFETIWRGIGTTITFHSKKKMSVDNDLRAEAYKNDEQVQKLIKYEGSERQQIYDPLTPNVSYV